MDAEALNKRLVIAPFHRWLGLSVRSASAEGIEIEMPWREEMISNAAIGSTHGGILASLVDLTGVYTLLAAGVRVSATADMHMDYHRPAIRETVVAQARPVKIGTRVSVAETKIVRLDGTLIASGRGAYLSAGS